MSYSNHPIRLVGGRLCLDFLNTADWGPNGSVVHEKLVQDSDVAAWCDAAGLTDVDPKVDSLPELLAFRAALRDAFLAVLAGDVADVGALNSTLASLPDVAVRGSRHGAAVLSLYTSLRQAIAVSAVAILCQPSEGRRVKMCPGDRCGWLFVDESRTGTRQWCSMETCGNRAKARRHYLRNRAKAQHDAGPTPD